VLTNSLVAYMITHARMHTQTLFLWLTADRGITWILAVAGRQWFCCYL